MDIKLTLTADDADDSMTIQNDDSIEKWFEVPPNTFFISGYFSIRKLLFSSS